MRNLVHLRRSECLLPVYVPSVSEGITLASKNNKNNLLGNANLLQVNSRSGGIAEVPGASTRRRSITINIAQAKFFIASNIPLAIFPLV